MKTKDLRHTEAERGKRTDNKTQPKTSPKPRIAAAERRVKPLRGSYAALRPRG